MSLIRFISASICRGVFQQCRAISTTPAAQGLEDFFDKTVKEGERVTVGVPIESSCFCLPCVVHTQFHLQQHAITAGDEGEPILIATGRAWEAADLRLKSWDDLHKLWYVLLKERNMLRSDKDRFRAQGKTMPNGNRMTKVGCFPSSPCPPTSSSLQ